MMLRTFRQKACSWGARALLPALLLSAAACATSPVPRQVVTAPLDRAFDFERDSYAFANDLIWQYQVAALGNAGALVAPQAPSDYHHRCFPVVRSARQFLHHARFDPQLAPVDDATYRRLIGQVMSRSSSDDAPDLDPVVIPGYADLRRFSQAKTALLKDEIGGAVDSYLQIGNWRMIFPFSRGSQQDTAIRLLGEVRAHRPPIVHVVRFPVITINHAVLIYDAVESPRDIRFLTYDPNDAQAPIAVTYERASRTFIFPKTDYFAGGPVNLYEVYRDGLY
ncbi:MAG: hypothetical protein ACRETE_08985 [Stenotrophobium sp.]